jgi:acyl-[acyl-carrier-protein]-phospholipid O-acyltransferase/long-chain-fatty-acid--[acyl-carrier-protein] ligase
MDANPRRNSPLLRDVIESCRLRTKKMKLADALGTEMSGSYVLIAALVLRRLLRRLLSSDERHVGVLLPPAAATVVANLALAFDGRVTVGLNYSLTPEILNGCLARAGVRHVITSRAFLERVPLRLDTEFIYLEDLRELPTKFDKIAAALMVKTLPAGVLLKLIGRSNMALDEPLMVVFTSGTTGEPKGAVLTYDNTAAGLAAIAGAMRLEPDDVIVGVLPFFHAFGSVVTLWAVLSLDVAAVYHPNPFDADGVGRLCRKRRGTILLATPTFLRAYQRRGDPADFATLQAIMTGGERLTVDLANDVECTFGIRPVEGYGATEATSLIASNVPVHRAPSGSASVCREGTVGRSLPGIQVKIVDPETGAELPFGNQGLLMISGRNVMAGYLGSPAATAEVLHDGWYATGDIAVIDAGGCIEIVGRRSRFAKVGGEMVPLGRIEDALTACAGDHDAERPLLAVVAVADETRGERLMVIHRAMASQPGDLRRALIAAGLPPVFVPAAGDFIQIEELPLTATGKLDFARLRELATAAVSARQSAARPPVAAVNAI